MNEKVAKVEIDFNEALWQITKTAKGVVISQDDKSKVTSEEKAAPSKRKGAAKVTQLKQR
jgi:hypothetical protein